MPYTNIAKPTGANYTNVEPAGKEPYDDLDITYDDANAFYDGIDQAAYTNIAKPVGSVYTKIAKPV